MKRQLKYYNGHLIGLLCIFCLSDYGNEAPCQFIKVRPAIADVCAQRQIRLCILLIWCGLDNQNVFVCLQCVPFNISHRAWH